MKPFFWLFLLPLVSATLIPRQEAQETPVTCMDVCFLSALADSTKDPKCNVDDLTCLCVDDGWVGSFTTCVTQICPANTTSTVFYALKESCKKVGAPLHSQLSHGWTASAVPVPGPSATGSETAASTSWSYKLAVPWPEATASALSSALAVASSVVSGTTWATGKPTATGTSGASLGAAVGFAPVVGVVIGLVGVGLVV